MSTPIDQNEELFRAVSYNPNMWKEHRPSSALFKDSKGVSVDIRANRSNTEVVEFMKKNLGEAKIKAIAEIKVEVCLAHGCTVVADSLEHNPYHALILPVSLKSSVARKLAASCDIILSNV